MPIPFVDRRDVLLSTLSGFGYVALGGVATQAAIRASHFPARAKRVILLYMQGGVSHVDTFDYKPELQKQNGIVYERGKGGKLLASPWKFKQHGHAGHWISQLFPHIATQADELCMLSAMHTEAQAHETAVPMFHTGNQLQARPSIGSWVVYGLGAETENLPGFIAMNPLGRFGGNNHGSAFLPATYQATIVQPSAKESGDPVANLKTTHLTKAVGRNKRTSRTHKTGRNWFGCRGSRKSIIRRLSPEAIPCRFRSRKNVHTRFCERTHATRSVFVATPRLFSSLSR